jgi:hypothetical protein
LLWTHVQRQGGFMIITGLHYNAATAALAEFASKNVDKKAGVLPVFNTLVGIPTLIIILFYDAPTPPLGLFDKFTAIPHLTSNVNKRTFSNFIQSIPSDNPLQGSRAAFLSMTVERISPAILKEVVNQTLVSPCSYPKPLSILSADFHPGHRLSAPRLHSRRSRLL